MRFARIHPSFLIFFGLSVAGFAVALIMALNSADACNDSGSSSADAAICATKGQGEGAGATVLALGGLAAMLGGVGFQIGRARPTVAPVAVPPGAAPAWYATQPGYPAYPAPGGYPPPPASTPPAS